MDFVYTRNGIVCLIEKVRACLNKRKNNNNKLHLFRSSYYVCMRACDAVSLSHAHTLARPS